MVEITSEQDLRDWLQGKPDEWGQVIAVRAGLRTLPTDISQSKSPSSALIFFREASTFWASYNYPDGIMGEAADDAADYTASCIVDASMRIPLAADIHGAATVPHTTKTTYPADTRIRAAAYTAARTADHSPNSAAVAANNAAKSLARADNIRANNSVQTVHTAANTNAYWEAVASDAAWLAEQEGAPSSVAQKLSRRQIWTIHQPDVFRQAWRDVVARLLNENPSFSPWVEWFNRRITGNNAAFHILKDQDRTEDKAILRRLADATDESFWDKGYEHINATLQQWLDEARARAVENPVPKQEDGAPFYGLNDHGKIDRLPATKDDRLRDEPNQRRAYSDLRNYADELASEGQRLGSSLSKGLASFRQSMPERFDDAEAYLVWRDATRLRRILYKHEVVSKSPDPDPNRLEPTIAADLAGLLGLYNNFSFADDGLRAKDEASISPQEKTNAEQEAALGGPIDEAILESQNLATERVLDDITAAQETSQTETEDPYKEQALDQANQTRRNFIAFVLSAAAKARSELGKDLKSIREGAGRAIGALIVSDVTGITGISAPIIEFISHNAAALSGYITTAFSNYSPRGLIDWVIGRFKN